MGGRGAFAPLLPRHLGLQNIMPRQRGPQIPPPVAGTFDYNVISSLDLDAGGARYDFLEELGREWSIVTRELDGLYETIHPHHSFSMDTPTLRWVKDDTVVDVYIDGMSKLDYFEATGLRFHNEAKGPYVLSKRISRVMRPHFISGEFAPDEVRVKYMDEADFAQFSHVSAEGPKVWDGAGVVSRRMLEKMVIPEGTSPAKAARLQWELAHSERVEFTIMTERGQDKGHAMVADDLDVDFLLPHDTKREITLENGKTWVGIDFVRGKHHMRLDIQSMINLQPFFSEERFAQWLHDEGELFAQAVESGEVAEAMARVDRFETLDDVPRWATREYFASGGHPLHFQRHVKALMDRHLERLNHSTLRKLRLPIPGGRYYVMPQAVGTAAGYQLDVPRGELRIDQRRGTAWVNDEDWLSLQDSPTGEGIAGILGGADHDDALWLHPFTDHDGEQKVLVWRSPNQMGEYVLLKPTSDSDIPDWTTAEGEKVTFPAGNSRKLPRRIDTHEPTYQGLVDPSTAEVLGRGEAYSIEAMDWAIERSLANQGALGMYCNSLMVNKAVFADLPASPPAPLEDIIDSSVKTGADLSRVVQWNYDNSRQILEARTPIPALLHDRLSRDYNERENLPPRPLPTADHWLDRTESVIKEHIDHMRAHRDQLVARAMPPRQVFDSVFDDPDALEWGAKFNAVYGKTLAQTGRDFDSAREASEAYLARFPDEEHGRVLRGAIASSYMSADKDGKPLSDAAVWQRGSETETGERLHGIAHKTLGALREIGVIDEIGETAESVVVYPGALVREPTVRTLGIRGVWFNLHKEQARATGQSLPENVKMRDVSKARRAALKDTVEEQSQTTYRDIVLRVDRSKSGQLLAYTDEGNLFGKLQHADESIQPGDRIRLNHTRARDGNLRSTYSKLPPQKTA